MLTTRLLNGRDNSSSIWRTDLDGLKRMARVVANPLLLALVAACASTPSEVGEPVDDELVAFPGAEGFGAIALGGRGGRIIEVTSLADAGPGSLRAALETSGPRIVVFRVAGLIELADVIRIRDSYLTVAGQTAPGGGITIRGTNETLLRVTDGAHDIVIRYLRLRNGAGEADGSGHDNFTIRHGERIIIDHVSTSWASDENGGMYVEDPPPDIIRDVSIQRSVFAEGLRGHSNGFHISGRADYSNPDAPIEYWRQVTNISMHHNLFVHNTDRNPRVTSAGTAVINNVVYNWGFHVGSTSRGSIIDHINNYFKAGPMSDRERILLHDSFIPGEAGTFPDPSIFAAGNLVETDFMDPAADNWVLYQLSRLWTPLPQEYRRLTPLAAAPVPVTLQSAAAAYESVLADVGANARLNCRGDWLPALDPVDGRLLADVRQGTGPTDAPATPADAGGYPPIDPGTPCPDGDSDGMPDEWERLHGFDPANPADGPQDADGDGYTNVEEFLNGTNP